MNKSELLEHLTLQIIHEQALLDKMPASLAKAYQRGFLHALEITKRFIESNLEDKKS